MNTLTTKTRISRFKRVENPPKMVLTKRDKRIILAVYENRFLRRDQIERLFFSNPTSCNRRLMRLYQHGYLDRIHKPVSFGASQVVYALDKRGADIVAQELEVNRSKIHWKRRNNLVELLFLEHTLAINEFYINLKLAIREKDDVEVLLWKRESKELNDRVPDPEGKRKYLTVSPDAFFGILTSSGKSYFFLEVDLATESNTRFKRKILAYKQYWKTGRYTQRFGFKSFRVLTVTTGQRRLKNLLQTTQKASGKNMFLFTTKDKIKGDEILKRIWLRTTSKKLISILE